MKAHTLMTVLLLLLLLASSCSPDSPPAAATEIPTAAPPLASTRSPVLAPTDTPTPRPSPTPIPTATPLPAPTPTPTESVPWTSRIDSTCAPGQFDADSKTLTLANTAGDYFDPETEALPLDSRLHIRVGAMAVANAHAGSIKILGIPEGRDPWYEGISRLDIQYDLGVYLLGLRDGSSESYVWSTNLPLSASQPIQVQFEDPQGKVFRVLDGNGRLVSKIDVTRLAGVHLPDGLFPNREMYFGFSVVPGSALTVTDLAVETEGTVEEPGLDLPGPGLVELARGQGITLGTEFTVWRMIDPRYCHIMRRDFDVAILSEFSHNGLWLGPGEYDFGPLDRAVDFANRNGWRVRGSHLVWGAVESGAIPDWLLHSNCTRDECIRYLEQHVKTIVGRYKGRVHEWSIANEAPSRALWNGDFWLEKIGPEYVEMAFRWAREADPQAVLIFNENNNESPRDADTGKIVDSMVGTVSELKARGVPIDVVGMQMHLLMKYSSPVPPTKEDVIATMRRFADLGVRIYVTEFDVTLSKHEGTETEAWEYQAQLYREMMEACLDSGVCDSFATWGVSDSTTWVTCSYPGCLNDPEAAPLMFSVDFSPKPAYFAVREALAARGSDSAQPPGAGCPSVSPPPGAGSVGAATEPVALKRNIVALAWMRPSIATTACCAA